MKNFNGRRIVASFTLDEESGFIDFGEEIGALSVIDDKLIVVTDQGSYRISEDDLKSIQDAPGASLPASDDDQESQHG